MSTLLVRLSFSPSLLSTPSFIVACIIQSLSSCFELKRLDQGWVNFLKRVSKGPELFRSFFAFLQASPIVLLSRFSVPDALLTQPPTLV